MLLVALLLPACVRGPAYEPDKPSDDTAWVDHGCDGDDGDCYTPSGGDCDDTDPTVNPGADEICDGKDNDCNDEIDADDPGLVDGSVYYTDADADGYGDPDAPVTACDQPEGTLADASDCDDTSPAIHPAALETCDGLDDDCDTLVDDADSDVGATAAWYTDDDGDGYGTGDPVYACLAPDGTAAIDGDCDDGEPAVNPGAVEICGDVLDEDCDGSADGCASI